jgi:hypothetical protein
MTFLIMMLVLVMILRNVSGGRYMSSARTRWHGGRMEPWWMERKERLEAPQQDMRVAPPRETPLETLQRRFAAGAISVEEYEREVGKLFGLK